LLNVFCLTQDLTLLLATQHGGEGYYAKYKMEIMNEGKNDQKLDLLFVYGHFGK
jgi:hypothetical protein